MTTGSREPVPAVRPGSLRASHADRERVIDTLKAAFVQGRLTKDEFDARVGQTFGSRTYAELAVITADIPAGLAAARPLHEPARVPMNSAAKAGICVSIALVTLIGLTALAGPAGFMLCVVFYFLASLAAGAEMLDKRHQRRCRAQHHQAQPTPLLPEGGRPLSRPLAPVTQIRCAIAVLPCYSWYP